MASMCSLERRGRVWILTLLGEGEHRLNPGSVQEILDALEPVKAAREEAAAALVTVNEGRYFCNGLDLEWGTDDTRKTALARCLNRLLAAFMNLSMPTVAALCGHTCAGGALLAMAHDYRYMRRDRGFFYMSEVDVDIPIPRGPMLLMRRKLCPSVLRDAILSGKKYTADMALQAGIVDGAFNNSLDTTAGALREAEALASRGWSSSLYLSLRLEMHREVVDNLERDDAGPAGLNTKL